MTQDQLLMPQPSVSDPRLDIANTGANQQTSEYVDFWNEVLVPKFIAYKHILVDGLTHHSEAIFPNLPVREGDRVLDVGCGFGDTAMKLAERVGPSGEVIGIDCCESFLEFGRKEASSRGFENVSFVEGDALNNRFEPSYDFVFSRFGTMFFENLVAGLKNMRSFWASRMSGSRWTVLDSLGLTIWFKWQPVGESNPCFRRERAAS
jgi:SAM-dependent methyltransferase